MSEQHRARNLAAFDSRMNRHVKLGYSDSMHPDAALGQIGAKRLTYRRTVQAGHA